MRTRRYQLIVFIFGGIGTIVGGGVLLYLDKCVLINQEEKCEYIKYCWFEDNDCKKEPEPPEPNPKTEPSDDQPAKNEEPPPPLVEPFTFKINYLYRAKGEEGFQSLGNDSVLYAGAHYKLIFEPTENSYVYIFRIDSDNKISRLFPGSSFFINTNKNPVQKGKTYFVPAELKSFKLNKQPGKETIYFTATRQSDTTLEENQYRRMLAKQKAHSPEERLAARQEWDTAMASRGFAPELVADETQSAPITWKEKKQQSVMPQYLKGMCDGCVHIVSFQHR